MTKHSLNNIFLCELDNIINNNYSNEESTNIILSTTELFETNDITEQTDLKEEKTITQINSIIDIIEEEEKEEENEKEEYIKTEPISYFINNETINIINNSYELNTIIFETNEITNNIYNQSESSIDLNSINIIYERNNESIIIKQQKIEDIRNDLINGKINFTNTSYKDENEDYLLIKEKDIIYQITTSDNQNNNEYEDISTIQLGECEKILKDTYKIDQNLPLIIFKVDYFKEGLLIPVIGYEIYHPVNNSKLDLNYCKDKIADFQIPVSINEDSSFKYDPNSEYYTDQCYPYTTDDGTDILLNDRKNEFINNNMSLCENNCTYGGYSQETKKAACKCEIGTKEMVISEIINSQNLLSNNFANSSSTSKMVTMKCFYTLFTKEGIAKNIGNYILLFMTLFFIILGISFNKFGYPLLIDKINELIYSNQSKNNICLKNKKKNIRKKKKSKTIKSEKNNKKSKGNKKILTLNKRIKNDVKKIKKKNLASSETNKSNSKIKLNQKKKSN